MLRAYSTFVAALPDDIDAKGSKFIKLGYLSNRGLSAYKGETKEFTAAQALLSEVANGQIAATDKDLLTAREMVAHHLHYYSRKYTNALAAYRQILAEQLKTKNAPAATKARMEIAASYELAKVSGFDKGQLQAEINALWDSAVSMQEPLLEDCETTSARDVRGRTVAPMS